MRILAIVAMLFVVTACGGGGSDPVSMTTIPQDPPTKEIGSYVETPSFRHTPGSLGEAARSAALSDARFGSIYQSNDGDVRVTWNRDSGNLSFYLIDYNPGGSEREMTLIPVPYYDESCQNIAHGTRNCQVFINDNKYLLEVYHTWFGYQSHHVSHGWWIDIVRRNVGVFVEDDGILGNGAFYNFADYPQFYGHLGGSYESMTFSYPGDRFHDELLAVAPTQGGYVWDRTNNLQYGKATGDVVMELNADLSDGVKWFVDGTVDNIDLLPDQSGERPNHNLGTFTLDREQVRIETGNWAGGSISGGASGTYNGQVIQVDHTDFEAERNSSIIVFGTLGLTDIDSHDGLSIFMSYGLVESDP